MCKETKEERKTKGEKMKMKKYEEKKRQIAGVMAEEDLVFSGEVKNTGDVVIYSATGDVVIESTNVNVNGLIYAPHGEIRINSMN